jgi:hypothetical protein
MTFLELQDAVLRIVRDQSGHMRKAVKEWINWTLLDLSRRGDYYWWRKEGFFATDSFYSTGRISMKADSRVVSASATSWGKFISGAKLTISASAPGYTSDWYRVETRVTNKRANVESAFRGTSRTRKKYVLWRDEYRLKYDVDRIRMIRYLKVPDKLVNYYDQELYEYEPNPTRVGDPEIYRMLGISSRSYYDTSSASFVANSRVVTGSGTSFDATMIGRMIRQQSEGREYQIASAPSGTSLRIDPKYGGSNVGKVKYSIDPAGVPMIQLYPIPTKKYQFVYEYQKVPTLLYANNDQPELPVKHHEILIDGAIVRAAMQGVVVDPNVFAAAKERYYGFDNSLLATKTGQQIDRIPQSGRFDISRPQVGGRLDPKRYPTQPRGY